MSSCWTAVSEQPELARTQIRRERARRSLAYFVEKTATFQLDPWQHVLCRRLSRLATEAGQRLLIHAPPQAGKSVIVSQRFPAWVLGRQPRARVRLACYNVTHATRFGKITRDLMESAEYADLFPNPDLRLPQVTSAEEWSTLTRLRLRDAQPSFKALGLLTGFVGQGADLLILDDPYASPQDAASEVIRESVWTFWEASAKVRLNDDTNVVVMFHRYHEDDLAGRLWAQGGWEMLRFAAVADGEATMPDPMGRPLGEKLSPRMTDAYLEEQQKAALVWLGQFQGRPTSAEGLFFQVGKLEIVDAAPAGLPCVRYWDKAGAQPGKGDWTAGVKMSRQEPGFFYVEHVARGQWPAHERNPIIRQTAELDQQGGRVKQWIEQPPGLAKESTDAVIRLLAGLPCEADPVTKDKVERAEPFAAQVNAGNVRLVRGPWNAAFIEELRAFPQGKHDDQVDGGSGAFNKLAKPTQLLSDPTAHEHFWNRTDAREAFWNGR